MQLYPDFIHSAQVSALHIPFDMMAATDTANRIPQDNSHDQTRFRIKNQHCTDDKTHDIR
jgi:hypothetical protein